MNINPGIRTGSNPISTLYPGGTLPTGRIYIFSMGHGSQLHDTDRLQTFSFFLNQGLWKKNFKKIKIKKNAGIDLSTFGFPTSMFYLYTMEFYMSWCDGMMVMAN